MPLRPIHRLCIFIAVATGCVLAPAQSESQRLIGKWDNVVVQRVTDWDADNSHTLGTRYRCQAWFLQDGTLIKSDHSMQDGSTFARVVMQWRIAAPGTLILSTPRGSVALDFQIRGNRLVLPENGVFARGEYAPASNSVEPARPATCPICHMLLSSRMTKAKPTAVKLANSGKVMYCCPGCKMPASMLVKTRK